MEKRTILIVDDDIAIGNLEQGMPFGARIRGRKRRFFCAQTAPILFYTI